MISLRLVRDAVRIVALALIASLASFADASEPIEFTRDIVPVLTKAGCNAGACHGSLQGRGSFMLSLLGFNPAADYTSIVESSRGRRVRAATPEHSLLLRKATASAPHGGGRRLSADMPAYGLLRDYIAQGMRPPQPDEARVISLEVTPHDLILKPDESRNLRIAARWSDAVVRDVTDRALYNARDPSATEVSATGLVTARRPGKSPIMVRYMGQVASVGVTVPFDRAGKPFPDIAARNYIDTLVLSEWKKVGVTPSPRASDTEFLRRASLDLTGTLPAPDDIRKFLASTDPNKRQKVVDELLERPEYVDFWALKWGDLLRVHRRYLGNKGIGSVGSWLRRSIRENKPLDRMVYELLTAQGNLFTNGPVAYYFVDQKPEEMAETTSQLFLGVRLQCTRCHHHPMEVWSQDDYYGLAAFFTRLDIRENGDKGRFGGMQTLRAVPQKMKNLLVDAQPRVLGGAKSVDPRDGDVRKPLADSITSADNPYFARNFANRYWAYLVGRGLVEPIDDIRATNPPSNPELLDALAKDFTEHHFDVKHLLRTICNSEVYQLSVEIAPERDKDGSLFSHRVPRRMPAEVLLDAINQATGFADPFAGTPIGTRAIALTDSSVPSTFLTTFGRPERNNACECAREGTPDLLQALHLANNTALHTWIVHPQARVAKLLSSKQSDAEIADELYLATFSRRPTESEFQTIRELLTEAPSKKEGWEDVLWTLLNSPEFVFNH